MKSTEELLKEIYAHFKDTDDPEVTVCNLIVDCIETGIDYWCTEWAEVNETSDFYSEDIWNALKSGETLEFGDKESIGTINLETIAKTLEKLKKTNEDIYKEIQDEDWDANTCDVFFQTALFGEVVFG